MTASQQLHDPLNGNAPFLNNVITEPIDPVAQALFSSSLYPSANGLNTQNNSSYIQNGLVNSDQYDIKIDFNATNNDHIFGRYSHAKQHNPTINSFALIGTGFSDAPIENGVVDWSHTFSSNLLNDVRFGVNHVRLHNGTEFDSSVGNLGTQLGIANANDGGPGLLDLHFNTGNGVLTNVGSSLVQQRFNDAVIQASDAVVMTHNRHVLHFGFEYWRDRINTFYTGNSGALGNISFNGAFTSSNPAGTHTGGYGGADFTSVALLVRQGNLRRTVGPAGQHLCWVPPGRLESHRQSHLNLGLRYEVHTPWTEAHDLQTNFDLFTGQLIAPDCSRITPLLGTAPVTCQESSDRGLYNGTYGAKTCNPVSASRRPVATWW